jgi:hypothetical protein
LGLLPWPVGKQPETIKEEWQAFRQKKLNYLIVLVLNGAKFGIESYFNSPIP